MPLTPNNREEHWLQGMVDGQTTLEPNKRREYWYKEIVDAIGSGGGGGTGGGVLVANFDPQTGALDKTWNEINSAPLAVIKIPRSTGLWFAYIIETKSITSPDIYFEVSCAMWVNSNFEKSIFECGGADEYPTLSEG